MARIPISCGAAADTLVVVVVGTLVVETLVAVVVGTLVAVVVDTLVVGMHCPYVACALVVMVAAVAAVQGLL